MRSNLLNEIIGFFRNGSVLSRLMGINVAIFVLLGIIRLVFFLMNSPAYETIIGYTVVPTNGDMLLSRPWTLLTYMFIHFDFFHILFNMIMLYVGGRLFSEFLGKERLSGTYILGGLSGALFFILAYNIFPVFDQARFNAVAIGASASVLAIFIAIATYMPNYNLPLILFGNIRLKYLALIFIVIDLLSIPSSNAGGHLAHLGGALWGFIYIILLKKGNDPGKFVSIWIKALGSVFKPRPKMRVEYRAGRPVTDDEYNRRRAENQKRMDQILDKISKHGYDSLTSEEKEILFRMSNKN